MPLSSDQRYMRRALALARKGYAATWPNPMVGAVLVRGGRIVGEGYHAAYGQAHAERLAIQKAGARAHGATLYINLEPCSHFGKTPPCAPAVAKAGIVRVVAAMQDPNPKVSGKGFRFLRRNRIKVETGLCRAEAQELNKVFLKRIRHRIPYVICKAALSLDGKIACANGEARWISGPGARAYAHELRASADAIVVGANTVLQDDPRLNARGRRLLRPKQPWRIVIEGKRRIARSAAVFQHTQDQRTVLVTADPARAAQLERCGLEAWLAPGAGNRVDLAAMLRRLADEGVSLALVEGGAEVHAGFLGMQYPRQEPLADEVQFIIAPKILGGRTAPGPVGGPGVRTPEQALPVQCWFWQALDDDLLVCGRIGTGKRRKGSSCLRG